jgi:hypothetical protein
MKSQLAIAARLGHLPWEHVAVEALFILMLFVNRQDHLPDLVAFPESQQDNNYR